MMMNLPLIWEGPRHLGRFYSIIHHMRAELSNAIRAVTGSPFVLPGSLLFRRNPGRVSSKPKQGPS